MDGKKSSVYAGTTTRLLTITDAAKLALSQPHENNGEGDRDIEQPPTWHLNEDFNNSVKNSTSSVSTKGTEASKAIWRNVSTLYMG